MGLDMYMKIGKRIPGKTFEEIQEIEDNIYLGDNKELLEEYKEYIVELDYYGLEVQDMHYQKKLHIGEKQMLFIIGLFAMYRMVMMIVEHTKLKKNS